MVNFNEDVTEELRTLLKARELPTYKDISNSPRRIKLVLKKDALAILKYIHEIDHDYKLARIMDFTPPTICDIKNQKDAVSHDFIERITVLTNSQYGGWWKFYEWVDAGKNYDGNSQEFNQAKEAGRVPYETDLNFPRNMEYDRYTRPDSWNKRRDESTLVLHEGSIDRAKRKKQLKLSEKK